MTDYCACCHTGVKEINKQFCLKCEVLQAIVTNCPDDYREALENADKFRLKQARKADKFRLKKDRMKSKIQEFELQLQEKNNKLKSSFEEAKLKLECYFQELELQSQERQMKFLKLPYAWMEIKHHEDEDESLETWKGDVAIIVQNNTEKVLHAHKFILSSKSPVFRKMFNNEMLEKETGVLRIEDATHPVVVAMVNFCYTIEISFNKEVTPEELLQVAHKYGIDLLLKVCEEELIETLDADNLPKRLKLAANFEVEELQEAAADYFKDNFDYVIKPVMEKMRDPPPCCHCLSFK